MHHSVFYFAYLDPGTGSMIIQSLIGVTAGVALFSRRAITSIRSKMKRSDSDSKSSELENKK